MSQQETNFEGGSPSCVCASQNPSVPNRKRTVDTRWATALFGRRRIAFRTSYHTRSNTEFPNNSTRSDGRNVGSRTRHVEIEAVLAATSVRHEFRPRTTTHVSSDRDDSRGAFHPSRVEVSRSQTRFGSLAWSTEEGRSLKLLPDPDYRRRHLGDSRIRSDAVSWFPGHRTPCDRRLQALVQRYARSTDRCR